VLEFAYNDIPLTTLQKNQWLSITQTKMSPVEAAAAEDEPPSNHFKELFAYNNKQQTTNK
jgi:hypothetical protein